MSICLLKIKSEVFDEQSAITRTLVYRGGREWDSLVGVLRAFFPWHQQFAITIGSQSQVINDERSWSEFLDHIHFVGTKTMRLLRDPEVREVDEEPSFPMIEPPFIPQKEFLTHELVSSIQARVSDYLSRGADNVEHLTRKAMSLRKVLQSVESAIEFQSRTMHRIENDAEAVKKSFRDIERRSAVEDMTQKLQCTLTDHDRTVTLEEMQDEEDKDDLFRIIQEELCWDEYGCEVVLPSIQEASDDEDFPFTGLDDIEEEEREEEEEIDEEEEREVDTDEEEEESYDSDETTTTELVSSLLDSVHPPNCRTAEREDEPEYEEDYSSEDIDWDKVPSLKTNSWSDVHEKNVANLIRLVGQLEEEDDERREVEDRSDDRQDAHHDDASDQRVETAWVEVPRLGIENDCQPRDDRDDDHDDESFVKGELAREKLRLLAETVVASKPITIKMQREDVMESVAARVDPIGPKVDPPAPASMSLLDQAAATLNMNDHESPKKMNVPSSLFSFFSSILPKNNKPSRPEMSVKFEPRVEIIEKREVEPQVQVSAPQAHMQDDMEDAAPIMYQMPQQQPLFASSMQLLSEMGWYDDDKNRQLLGKHQGDVSEVIRELLDMH